MVNPLGDATWRFMTLDTDGKIRMDCSSPERHGVPHRQPRLPITSPPATTPTRPARHRHPDSGLMNPNHYLAAAIDYLYDPPGRTGPRPRAVGKTAVNDLDHRPRGGRASTASWSRYRSASSGSSTDRSAAATSASAARRAQGPRSCAADGSTWTTDKDGIILALLAPEILGDHRVDTTAAVRGTGRTLRLEHLRRASTPSPTASRRRGWPNCRPRAGQRYFRRQHPTDLVQPGLGPTQLTGSGKGYHKPGYR